MQSAARRTALLGILCAEAIALSALEGLIPQFIPVPGIKPGFSNIVTMYAVISLGTPYALLITLFKAAFAVLTRGVTAGILSLCGGLMSLAVMVVFFRLLPGRLGLLGTAVLSSVFHNAGQLLAAAFILGKDTLRLFPVLTLAAVVTGILTGTVLKLTVPILEKQKLRRGK